MSLSSRGVRRAVKVAAVPAVGLTVALAGIVPAAQASAAPRWRFNKVITPGSGSDWLYSVATISRSDAWAAGANYTDGATRARLLVEHYNGHRWRQVAIPVDLAAVNPVADIRVGASSPANVWVFELLAGHRQRILRWDGRRWHLTTAPSWVLRGNPGYANDQTGLADVAVQSRSSAWVFSIGTNDKPSDAAHEVGGHWHLVQLPGVPASVAAVSGNDIWASGTNASSQPIIMHWNGHRWSSHAAPAGGTGLITADSSSSAWVLTGGAVEYWNGAAWTAIALPSFVSVWEIAADGHGGVWVWGLHSAGSGLQYSPNLFAHYSDGSWSVRNAPAIDGNDYAQLAAMAQVPGSTTVFGVGWVSLSKEPSGAIMRYRT